MQDYSGDTQTLKSSNDGDTIQTKKSKGVLLIKATAPFHILEADADFFKLTGHPQAELSKATLAFVVHPQDFDGLSIGITDQLKISNQTHHRFRLKKANDTYLSVHMQGDYFQLPNQMEVLKLTITDYTSLESIAMENLRAKSDLDVFAKTIKSGLSKHICDHQLSLLWANDYFYTLTGYSREEWTSVIQKNTYSIIHRKDLAHVINKIADITEDNTTEMDMRICCKDGTIKWLHLVGGFSGEMHNNLRVINVVLSDITPLMIAEENARIAMQQHMLLSEISEEIAYEYSFAADTLTFAKRYNRSFDFNQHIKQPFQTLPDSPFISGDTRATFISILDDIMQGDTSGNGEFKILEKSGDYAWYYTSYCTIYDDQKRRVKVIGLLKNIHAQKQEQQALLQKSQLDTATGLYNKAYTEHHIQQSLAQLGNAQTDALMIIDIDDFKNINDTYGHLIGDMVIADIAAAMKSTATTYDLPGRIGGDEFAIYLHEVLDSTMLIEKAESIANILREKYPKGGVKPAVTLSIGIVLAKKGTTYETLLEQADTALYHAKSKGKNCVILYTPEMERSQYSNQRVEGSLEQVFDLLPELIGVIDAKSSQLMYYNKAFANEFPDITLHDHWEQVPIKESDYWIQRSPMSWKHGNDSYVIIASRR